MAACIHDWLSGLSNNFQVGTSVAGDIWEV